MNAQIGNSLIRSMSRKATGSEELQPGGAEGVLGHFDAVEPLVADFKIEVERDLAVIHFATVFHDLFDFRPPGLLEPFDAESRHYRVPKPGTVACRSGLGHVVNERLAVFDRDDSGMRITASRGVGDKAAERKIAEQHPHVAATEQDIALAEISLAPASPSTMSEVVLIAGNLPSSRSRFAVGPQGLPRQFAGTSRSVGSRLSPPLTIINTNQAANFSMIFRSIPKEPKGLANIIGCCSWTTAIIVP